MAQKEKVMIIDSDEKLMVSVSDALKKEGYLTLNLRNPAEAIDRLDRFQPDLLLTEISLPGTDGIQFIRDIRKHSRVPIIVLSSRTDVVDKVLAFEMGADDFVTKPCDMRELTARVKALLRRCRLVAGSADEKQHFLSFPELTINLDNYTVFFRGERIPMPPKELELLYFLASSPNQVFTREQLLNNIWGYDYIGDTRTVDVHIKRLRRKLDGATGWSLTTVWGIGYKFEMKES